MGRCFCKQISPFCLDARDVQRGNEVRWRPRQEASLAPPCLNLRSFGSKCTVLKKVLMTLLGLFGPPQWFGARGFVPPAPSLRLWCYAMKIGKFSESKQIFKSERHEHLQFSNTIPPGSCTDCQQGLLAAFQVYLCSFVSRLCLPPVFFPRGSVFVLLIIKLFGHSTSYIFKFR